MAGPSGMAPVLLSCKPTRRKETVLADVDVMLYEACWLPGLKRGGCLTDIQDASS